MKTRVCAFCDAALEAGWLLAAVAVPLFFNMYTSRLFEADKLILLQAIASLMAAVWVAREVDGLLSRGGAGASGSAAAWREALRKPLVAPALLLVVAHSVATAASVAPRISLLGSYQRLQGTLSTLSYVVIFVLMLQGLRRREQLDRLLGAIILTSLPVAAYGLLQHYELDPLPWGDVTQRVASSMGDPRAVGAYLIMVIPLTLARLLHMQAQAVLGARLRNRVLLLGAFGALLAAQVVAWGRYGPLIGLGVALLCLGVLASIGALRRRAAAPYLLVGVYQTILSVQAVCLFFTESRAPMLGLAAGLFLFGALAIIARQRRGAQLAVVLASVAVATLLVLVNLPRSPLPGFRELPHVGKLGRLLEQDDIVPEARVLVWEGAAEMIAHDPVRTLIGYGPETMPLAYGPFQRPEPGLQGGRNTPPDRSHNETVDILLTTGFVGYLAYTALLGALFYQAFRWLGLIGGRGQGWLFALCVALGMLLGMGLIWHLDGSWRYAGLALPAGLMAGLAAHVCVVTLYGALRRRAPRNAAGAISGGDLLLVAGLLAGIVAHLIEIHYGTAVAATRAHFWLYAALLVTLSTRQMPPDVERVVRVEDDRPAKQGARGSRKRKERPRRSPAAERPAPDGRFRLQIAAMATVTGAILVTLLWEYTRGATGGPHTTTLLSLTTEAASGRPGVHSPGLLWLVLGTLLWALLVSVAEAVHRSGSAPEPRWWLGSVGVFLGVSGGAGVLFPWLHSVWSRPGADAANVIYSYLWAMLALWAALAILMRIRTANAARTEPLSVLFSVAVLALCLVGIDRVYVTAVRADATFKQGARYGRAGDWEAAIQRYDRTLALAPYEDHYWPYYGQALVESARAAPDSAAQQEYMERALAALERARELSPLNAEHSVNLAWLYRTWSELETDPAGRRAKLESAVQAYERAVHLNPANAQLVAECGRAHHAVGDLKAAEASYRASLAIDPGYTPALLLLGDVLVACEDWSEALEAYSQAVALDDSLTGAWRGVGYARSRLQDWERAAEAYLEVLQREPDDYNALWTLALLNGEMNRFDVALGYAERALDTAPEEHKASLETLIAELESLTGSLES